MYPKENSRHVDSRRSAMQHSSTKRKRSDLDDLHTSLEDLSIRSENRHCSVGESLQKEEGCRQDGEGNLLEKEDPCQLHTLFSSLPPEIQIKVWEQASTTEATPRLISIGTTPPALPRPICYPGTQEPDKIPPPNHVKFFSRTNQSSLFSTCYDSRQALLKQSPLLFESPTRHSLISANLTVDTIHFGPHFEMWQLRAFASELGPDKTNQIKFLALEYEVKGWKEIGDAHMQARRHSLEICTLFEKLEGLVFIPHDAEDGSDRLKGKTLCIMEWKGKDRGFWSRSSHWSCDLNDGETVETFAEWAVRIIGFSIEGQRRRRGYPRDPNWKVPRIEFMQLKGS